MGKTETKLKPFERMATNWSGLWYSKERHMFTSKVIDLAELKKFKGKVRISVVKNMYYNNGENGRPNYVFRIVDAKSDIFDAITVQETEDESEESRKFSYDEVQSIINAVAVLVGGSGEYGMHIVDDFV